MMKKKKLADSTLLCNDDQIYWEHKGAIVPPMYQNSLFAFDGWDAIDQAFKEPSESYIYSRLHNPTSRIVEKKIANLAGAEDAKLTASGMGAISAAILHFVNYGDHIVTIKDIYAPANKFINEFLMDKCGVTCTFVNGTQIEAFAEALKENTSLIYLESPASITMTIQDIKAIVKLAKEKGVKTVIDNTCATPLFQKCIGMGVDLEVHSVSKYLGGHSDIVAGVIIGGKKDLSEILMKEHALLGPKMAPFESWLLLRSLRTLSLRMKAHEEGGLLVAKYLDAHPKVKKVNHPGLKTFPQYDLASRQMSGFGSLMSFELVTNDLAKIKSFVDGLQLFHLGVSWGGYESLVYAPVISYAKELPPERFDAMGITAGLIRISVGLEQPDDLIQDLTQAFQLFD